MHQTGEKEVRRNHVYRGRDEGWSASRTETIGPRAPRKRTSAAASPAPSRQRACTGRSERMRFLGRKLTLRLSDRVSMAVLSRQTRGAGARFWDSSSTVDNPVPLIVVLLRVGDVKQKRQVT